MGGFEAQFRPVAVQQVQRDLVLEAAAEAHGLKLGDALQPVRVALTGSTVSEPVNELLAVVDRATALRRLGEVARQSDQGGARAVQV